MERWGDRWEICKIKSFLVYTAVDSATLLLWRCTENQVIITDPDTLHSFCVCVCMPILRVCKHNFNKCSGNVIVNLARYVTIARSAYMNVKYSGTQIMCRLFMWWTAFHMNQLGPISSACIKGLFCMTPGHTWNASCEGLCGNNCKTKVAWQAHGSGYKGLHKHPEDSVLKGMTNKRRMLSSVVWQSWSIDTHLTGPLWKDMLRCVPILKLTFPQYFRLS